MNLQVVRVQTHRKSEPGTILVLQLENERGGSLTVLVRVEDVQQKENTEWWLTCRLLQRVSAEEIEVLTGIQAPRAS